MDYVTLVLCGASAILLRVGMAIHAGGMVRSKNAAGILLRHLVDFCIAVLAVWAVGGAIVTGAYRGADCSIVIGFNCHSMFGNGDGVLFMMAAVALAGGIVVGVTAERARFLPMWWVSLVLGVLIVPVAWCWSAGTGWLTSLRYHDWAGASFIHLTGAICAAVAAAAIGPRAGKYNHDGSSNAIPGHNLPIATVGAMLMLAAWFAFAPGFHFGRVDSPANLLVSAAAGTLASLLISLWRYGKADIHLALCGLLGALVAASAGADIIPGWAAVIVGAGAGAAVPLAILIIDVKFRIDDPTGGIAIHGIGGAWGIVATGLFAPAASVGHWARNVGVQMLGLVAIAAWAAVVSIALFAALRKATRLRASEADEYDGLDLAEHDVAAYPDFQQNMIKSYHLREM